MARRCRVELRCLGLMTMLRSSGLTTLGADRATLSLSNSAPTRCVSHSTCAIDLRRQRALLTGKLLGRREPHQHLVEEFGSPVQERSLCRAPVSVDAFNEAKTFHVRAIAP